MDDSAVRNAPHPLHFIRSRSSGDLSTFDPAFDDVMRKVVEKNSYAKRLRPLIRQLVLLSLARSVLLVTALAVECMRIRFPYGVQRENQERKNHDKSAGRPFLLEHLPIALGCGYAFSLADLSMALTLWNSMRKMRGQWFLSAERLQEGTWMSVGCYESNLLKLHLDLYVICTILAITGMAVVMGTVQFFYPRYFLARGRHVISTLWHSYTVDVTQHEILLATFPSVGLAMCGLITAWKCRLSVLPLRGLYWAELQDLEVGLSDAVEWLYENGCYVIGDLVRCSTVWVGHVIFVLLRRKEVFCIND
ncbi:uncharacterized protein LOC129590823 isoform X1 [Paramacrobiotus metropolitanus]|uniref:uncharacterized protein LOC129590823 isoform X1 n=1 Tax=Paramacrobiotus metropolitanus TaxID=2943436 RepID=UPI0024464679|nr:uncharacterized protein LOC129590823 isoform X1 [Paramacrobiotus metropolitanus]